MAETLLGHLFSYLYSYLYLQYKYGRYPSGKSQGLMKASSITDALQPPRIKEEATALIFTRPAEYLVGIFVYVFVYVLVYVLVLIKASSITDVLQPPRIKGNTFHFHLAYGYLDWPYELYSMPQQITHVLC